MARIRQIPFQFILFAIIGCATPSSPPFNLKGTWHTVRDGDTIEKISNRYHVDATAVKELNDISNDTVLHQRQEIFIPKRNGKRPGHGGQKPPRRTVAATAPKTAPPKRSKPRCGENGRPCLLWPVNGPIITHYNSKGAAPHDGLDIKAAAGTQVRVVADGEVLYSGDQIKGYGNLVIVRHESGLITVYAHNRKNLVKEGDTVTRGSPIAEVGSTGSAAVPHLHFEIREGEKPLDPTDYLPPK